VNKHALALGKVKKTTEVSEVDASTQVVSCGTPLPGLDVRIVDPDQHNVLAGWIGWRDLAGGQREVPGILE
jgi:acyl-CoA synthetase (AMP-forming)/AMP-acid ligase II